MAKKEVVEDKVTIKPDLDGYTKTRAASGKPSRIRAGDPVAEGMVGFTLDDVYDVADSLGVEIKDGQYDHLNDGMQRMCVGNKIRGWITRTNRENEAAEANEDPKVKPGPDPMDSFEKVIAPIRKRLDKEEAAAAKTKETKAKGKKAA